MMSDFLESTTSIGTATEEDCDKTNDRFQGLASPTCHGLSEHPDGVRGRKQLSLILCSNLSCKARCELIEKSFLLSYLNRGLAYTVGSAIEEMPPTDDVCLDAFLVPNAVELTAGAKAWSKHAHRSEQPATMDQSDTRPNAKPIPGWWGSPKGPVSTVNAKALELFHRVMRDATWRNLHWLPHEVLVYEIRVLEGYGMRWSWTKSMESTAEKNSTDSKRSWVFRGFVEPMMENGHELHWQH